jgi:hypothetical protein
MKVQEYELEISEGTRQREKESMKLPLLSSKHHQKIQIHPLFKNNNGSGRRSPTSGGAPLLFGDTSNDLGSKTFGEELKHIESQSSLSVEETPIDGRPSVKSLRKN